MFDTKIAILIYRSLCILLAGVLIAFSLWIRWIRNYHSTAIERRQNYFRVDKERVQLWISIKRATKEVLQLSWITALFVIVGSFLRIIDFFAWNQACHILGLVVNYLYSLSNPFVYIFVMTDLRKQVFFYIRIFKDKLSLKNNVEPFDIQEIKLNELSRNHLSAEGNI